MRIWWCQEHESSRALDGKRCAMATALIAVGGKTVFCRLVPMRLIPDNAELAAALATYEHEREELQRGPSTELQVIAELVRGTT